MKATICNEQCTGPWKSQHYFNSPWIIKGWESLVQTTLNWTLSHRSVCAVLNTTIWPPLTIIISLWCDTFHLWISTHLDSTKIWCFILVKETVSVEYKAKFSTYEMFKCIYIYIYIVGGINLFIFLQLCYMTKHSVQKLVQHWILQ